MRKKLRDHKKQMHPIVYLPLFLSPERRHYFHLDGDMTNGRT